MASPIIVSCPVNVWTLINTGGGIKTGTLWVKDTKADYFQTYRVTGAGAPANDVATLTAEGIRISEDGQPIAAEEDIDVYIYCTGSVGVIRADLPG